MKTEKEILLFELGMCLAMQGFKLNQENTNICFKIIDKVKKNAKNE